MLLCGTIRRSAHASTYPFEFVEVDKDILEYLAGLVCMKEQDFSWILHLCRVHSDGGGVVVAATAAGPSTAVVAHTPHQFRSALL